MIRHVYLIRAPWISIYLGGSFCAIEVDIPNHTFQFFTKRGLFNYLDTNVDAMRQAYEEDLNALERKLAQ
jgi:hypothetical protein